jgi:hypothetical protein
MIYAVNEELIGRIEPPARSSPRFCGDTSTNAAKSSFELSQQFAVSIGGELSAQGSEDKIDIKEHN